MSDHARWITVSEEFGFTVRDTPGEPPGWRCIRIRVPAYDSSGTFTLSIDEARKLARELTRLVENAERAKTPAPVVALAPAAPLKQAEPEKPKPKRTRHISDEERQRLSERMRKMQADRRAKKLADDEAASQPEAKDPAA